MNQIRRVNAKATGLIALALTGMLALAACSSATEVESTSMTRETDANMNTTGNDSAGSAYQKITADEAKTLMDGQNVTIVDVRTAQEYAEGHLPGAINIPVESIGDDKPAELTDTDATLIVYCRTGVRSKQASDKLISQGYQHVNDMGGIVDWTGEKVTGTQPK